MADQIRPAVAVGAQARAALAGTRGPWTVLQSSRAATYLTDGADVVAVTSRETPDGPLYIRTDAGDVRAAPGLPVVYRGGVLTCGRMHHGVTDAPVWEGRLPDAGPVWRHREILLPELEAAAGGSALTEAPYAGRVSDVERFGWEELVAAWLGLGPGLTPAGDDALAGYLMVAIATGRLAPGSWQAERASRRTNRISLAFLRCAAEGQAISPVHDILHAGAAADRTELRRAMGRLRSLGATSGSDIAFGMAAALRRERRFHPAGVTSRPIPTALA